MYESELMTNMRDTPLYLWRAQGMCLVKNKWQSTKKANAAHAAKPSSKPSLIVLLFM